MRNELNRSRNSALNHGALFGVIVVLGLLGGHLFSTTMTECDPVAATASVEQFGPHQSDANCEVECCADYSTDSAVWQAPEEPDGASFTTQLWPAPEPKLLTAPTASHPGTARAGPAILQVFRI